MYYNVFPDPLGKGIPEKEWKSILDVKCGYSNMWDPPVVPGRVDSRDCKAQPPRNDRLWRSYEDFLNGDLSVASSCWHTCRKRNGACFILLTFKILQPVVSTLEIPHKTSLNPNMIQQLVNHIMITRIILFLNVLRTTLVSIIQNFLEAEYIW